MDDQECFKLFGKRVNEIRESIRYTNQRGRYARLTQEEFGLQAGKFCGGAAFTRDDVNNWESGKRHLTQKDFDILLAILQVFHKYGKIKTLAEANELLAIDCLNGLNPEQAARIDPAWGGVSPVQGGAEPAKDSTPKIEVTHNETDFEELGLAPQRPDLFVGRDNDMDAIKSRLFSGEKQSPKMHVLTAMRGWPGVGKTALASALANDLEVKAGYPDGVLWATLGQEPDFLGILKSWGRACRDPQILLSRSVEEYSKAMKRILKNKRCLLIIDDIWKMEHARPFFIASDGCATLFTTRRMDIASAITSRSSQIYPVEVLKKTDSFDLLKELAGEVVERYPRECDELLEEVNGLPLAIQVAGRMLQTEYQAGLDVPRLIGEMKNTALLLQSKAPVDQTDLEKETTPTVAAVLMKSLDCLDEKDRDYFALLGGFSERSDAITLDLLTGVWQTEHPEPIIRTLVGHGLLEYSKTANEYKIHGVLKLLAKTLWNKRIQE